MTSSNANLEQAPLDNFSECHSGIVRHLNDLDSLVPLLEPARQAHKARRRGGALLPLPRSSSTTTRKSGAVPGRHRQRQRRTSAARPRRQSTAWSASIAT